MQTLTTVQNEANGWTACGGTPMGIGLSGFTVYSNGQGRYIRYDWRRNFIFTPIDGQSAGTQLDSYGVLFWMADWATSCAG